MTLGTFSATTQAGLTSRMTSSIAGQSQRSSALPLRFPHWAKGWHGKPPVSRVAPRWSPPRKSRTSGTMGTDGQCLRRTDWQKGSRSQKTVVRKPAHPAARDMPPMPEKRSTWVSSRPWVIGGILPCDGRQVDGDLVAERLHRPQDAPQPCDATPVRHGPIGTPDATSYPSHWPEPS